MQRSSSKLPQRTTIILALMAWVSLTLGCRQPAPQTANGVILPTDNTVDKVCKITAQLMAVDSEDVQPTTSLADLSADELDIVELILELESQFEISIPDEAITEVTGDVWQDGFDKLTMQRLAEICVSQPD